MSVNQAVNTKNQFTLLGYGYDAAGNVTSDGLHTSGCASGGYAWNAEEMATCTAGVTYTFNGDEQRVKKSTGTMYWGGEAGDALAESDLSGNLTSEYIFIGARRIARRDISSGNTYYYFSDHLGSSNVITDALGSVPVLDESDYYPFGGESVITNSLSNHYKFTGKERDSESGNDYFGARYYSSSMGRFMSPDWSAKEEPVPYASLQDPQSLNLYAYVRNNPLSRVDPNGHECPLCKVDWGEAWKGLKQGFSSMFGGNSGPSMGDMSPSQRNGFTAAYILGAISGDEEEFAGPALSTTERLLPRAAEDAGVVGAAADAAADAAQESGRTNGTASALKVGDQVFTDTSTGGASRTLHPKVQEALDSVPKDQRSEFHGACAEPGCASQAMHSGVNPDGGTAAARRIRKPGHPRHSTPIAPCSTCQHMNKQLGINQ